ncbi:MAG: hypothetical protein HEEMFOPI_01671 [Holosporales bacterium]
MNAEEFIKGLKIFLRDNSQKIFFDFYEDIPGRNPHEKDVCISNGIKNFKDQEKELLKLIIEENIDQTIFSFLCILDHVRFIEEEGEKTTFELYAVKGDERVLINDPNNEELHNIYNDLVRE